MDRLVKMGNNAGYLVETDGQIVGIVTATVRGYAGSMTDWRAYGRSDLLPLKYRKTSKKMPYKDKNGVEFTYLSIGGVYPTRGAAVRSVFRVADV